jgi:hypothetical protein
MNQDAQYALQQVATLEARTRQLESAIRQALPQMPTYIPVPHEKCTHAECILKRALNLPLSKPSSENGHPETDETQPHPQPDDDQT